MVAGSLPNLCAHADAAVDSYHGHNGQGAGGTDNPWDLGQEAEVSEA